MANKGGLSKEELEDHFDSYVNGNGIELEDEEALKELLLDMYKTKAPITRVLNWIEAKHRDGYGHISDVDIPKLGLKYFEVSVFDDYEGLEHDLRELGGSIKHLSETLGVSDDLVYQWKMYDSRLSRCIVQARNRTTKMVVNRLLMKCDEGDMQALKFYLISHKPEIYRTTNQVTNDGNDEKTKLEELADEIAEDIKGMSPEERMKWIDDNY
ncbi:MULTISPECIES: hypothetical protein [Pontibacillus]|uniref:Uncharacterized protein n=1 Tax=Pontibacillus chungwhensis TaxID=265426 RepID=A0ABY8V2X5_9BACI|nr:MULTISPECIES: hypothetical protein [Pontibacillus]MCD5326134.1 hypothetical protein [Pontibacillus sp. HN14]WIG00308.1 hypothetical protein QNI29_20895 [Pontibacillus chungwhensis]